MGIVNLSWVITTRNKLVFLKEVLSRLIVNIHEDEEIIVVDGASTDGTVEYLNELKNNALIHCFISEPDHGEAEGYNKGLLMANGKLIKIITDDDAFYLPGIRYCKQYMLSYPHIDLIATDGAGIEWSQSDIFCKSAYSANYQEWVKTSKPFSFCGLGIMLRKQSIPLLGLFHTGVIRVDAEYSLRVTSGKAQIAWFTGCTWVRITNVQSNSVVYSRCVDFEGEKLHQFYTGESISPLPDYAILDLAKRGIGTNSFDGKSSIQHSSINMQEIFYNENIPQIFQMCDVWLSSCNQNEAQHQSLFLTK